MAAIGAGAVAIRNALDHEPWQPGFSPCTVGAVRAECGRVSVPERRGGRTISLRVVAIPATEQPARGALFYLEGGPGGAASEAADRVNETFARTLARRDVVLVDQRGTGGSHRLACHAARVRATDEAEVAAYLRRCFARFPQAGSYTTAVAADDIERVRRALGYGRIDVYGSSYGGTAAQVFLQRHPGSVRTLTLDSTTLLGVPVYARSSANAQRALSALFARCRAERACSRPERDLATLLARPPRRVTIPDQRPFLLTSDDVARTVEALLTDPLPAATIPVVLHEAVAGRYDRLAQEFVRQVGLDLDARWRLAMVWTILCGEPWAGYGTAAGSGFLAHANRDRARLLRQVCRGVPKGVVPRGSEAPPHTPVPVLLLAGGADPRDPPANLRGWRTAFPNGRLVVVPTAGHGVISTGCLPAVVARFVERGSARGLDTSCVRDVRPPPFERP